MKPAPASVTVTFATVSPGRSGVPVPAIVPVTTRLRVLLRTVLLIRTVPVVPLAASRAV